MDIRVGEEMDSQEELKEKCLVEWELPELLMVLTFWGFGVSDNVRKLLLYLVSIPSGTDRAESVNDLCGALSGSFYVVLMAWFIDS